MKQWTLVPGSLSPTPRGPGSLLWTTTTCWLLLFLLPLSRCRAAQARGGREKEVERDTVECKELSLPDLRKREPRPPLRTDSNSSVPATELAAETNSGAGVYVQGSWDSCPGGGWAGRHWTSEPIFVVFKCCPIYTEAEQTKSLSVCGGPSLTASRSVLGLTPDARTALSATLSLGALSKGNSLAAGGLGTRAEKAAPLPHGPTGSRAQQHRWESGQEPFRKMASILNTARDASPPLCCAIVLEQWKILKVSGFGFWFLIK